MNRLPIRLALNLTVGSLALLTLACGKNKSTSETDDTGARNSRDERK